LFQSSTPASPPSLLPTAVHAAVALPPACRRRPRLRGDTPRAPPLLVPPCAVILLFAAAAVAAVVPPDPGVGFRRRRGRCRPPSCPPPFPSSWFR